jgi:HAD superfamily hydrolase (TIGR01509 family)
VSSVQEGREAPVAVALDFDGLICDGTYENMLITWNSYRGKGMDAFGERGVGEIPAAFAERFRASRGFARHLGHFLVPLVTDEPVRSQREFDARYDAIDGDDVVAFVEDANEYRRQARARWAARWLGYHELYEGMHGFLRSLDRPLHIVTAKDDASVLAILGDERITVDPGRVFGGLRSKVGTLAQIAEREGADPARLIFLDDSIRNVVTARQAGYDARWATWGYNAPEHFDTARAEGVPTIALDDLPTLAAAWS